MCNFAQVSYFVHYMHSKTCHKRPLKTDQKLVFKTDYRFMQVKSISECPREHSAILSIVIKLLFSIKIFALPISVSVLHRFTVAVTAE